MKHKSYTNLTTKKKKKKLLFLKRLMTGGKAALGTANASQMKMLRNICWNACCGKVKVNKTAINRNHRATIRTLADPTKVKSLIAAKRYLKRQSGGWINLLIPPVLALLSTLGSQAVKRAVPA